MRMVEVAMDGSDDRDQKGGGNRLALLHIVKRRNDVPCRPNIELFLNEFFRTFGKGTQRVSAEVRTRFLYWGTEKLEGKC